MQPTTDPIDLDSAFRGLLALFIASFVTAVVPAIASQSMFVMATAFFVAAGHATFLGLPVFLVLRRFGWINVATSILAGLFIGIIPAGIEWWPSEARTGHIEHIDGIPTRVFSAPVEANWSEYLESLILPGVLGALAGFAFWLTIKTARHLKMMGQTIDPARRYGNPLANPANIVVGIALLATASIGAHFALGAPKKDDTCHNMLRDGRTSISPKLSMGLQIEMEDWAELVKVFEELGAVHSLDLRKFGTIHPRTVRTMSLSLCNESGLHVTALDQRWASKEFGPVLGARGMPIGIYETAEGSLWQSFGTRFVDELEARWPGKLKFFDRNGHEIPRPDSVSKGTRK